MAKRSCPFTDDFITQSKVHVGLKQFNNNEGRRQKIYERTLELLFKGSKRCNVNAKENGALITCCKKDNMKQLCIGTNGILEHMGKCETAFSNTQVTKYCDCREMQILTNDMSNGSCAYCEMSLCSSCSHTCSHCQQNYCLKCLVLGSDGPEICVSCYG